jgi:phenylacetate-CoA ligase
MPKQDPMDRTKGFFKKNLETIPHKKRIEYLNRKLRGIIQYAYKHSAAVRNKLDSVGLKPKDIQTIKDLEKLPITKKTDLVELQKKNPPFGGFEGVPISELRRIYVSPGPINEPGEMEYDELGWAQAFYAGGFRPETLPLIPSATIWFPSPCTWWTTPSYDRVRHHPHRRWQY